VAIKAQSRVVDAEVLPDDHSPTAVAFPLRVMAWKAALGVWVHPAKADSMYRATLSAKAMLHLAQSL
jgi:hypothetical protein